MKSCPVCQQTYTDDTLRFCLQDGALLVGKGDARQAFDPSATLVLPQDGLPGSNDSATVKLDERELAAALAEGAKLAPPGPAAHPSQKAGAQATPSPAHLPLRRDKIFISYSHQDRDWLKRFRIYLTPYFQHDDVSAWDDREIRAGTRWFDEIDGAINSACVAVLLVTPDFFASEFITKFELPRLKEAARTDGLQILWIAVRSSAVSETEIGEYQGLNNPAEPLASLNPAAQDAKFVEICKEIKQRARPLVPAQRERQEQETALPLTPLRSFDVHMADIGPAVADAKGRFWVANAQQVKIFEVKQEKPVETWLLPRKYWKHHLSAIWRDQLLISDWDGSLFKFQGRGSSSEQTLYRAQSDDLPIHRLAVGPEEQLLAATWDGLIRVWDADGNIVNHSAPTALAYLPLHVMPLAAASLALVDQAHYLRLYDGEGREIWTWQAPGVVSQVWPCLGQERRTFILQVADRLLKISEGETRAEEVKFDERIVGLSRSLSRTGEEWIIVAREEGKLDWLSTSLFSIVEDNSLTLDFAIQEILSIHDPQQPASFIALGMTAEGQLFTVNGQDVTLYETPERIERLVLDQTGRFLFLLSGNQLNVYRNPAIIPARCQVELAEPVKGRLEVSGFKKLVVKLKNIGLIPIHEIRAELSAAGIIDSAKVKRRPPAPVAPGEIVELEFSVRAKVHGDLPLDMKVELADEGGPPFSIVELSFSIEAVASRSSHDGE